MTVREMQIMFERKLRIINPELHLIDRPESNDTLYFLNRAQELYIETSVLNKQRFADNVEELQRRSDIIRNLIKRNTSTLSGTPIAKTDTNDGAIEFALPSDYAFYIHSNTFANGTSNNPILGDQDGDKQWIPNRVGMHDELDKIITNAFNTPILRKPVIIFEGNDKLYLYTDSYTNVYRFDLIYLAELSELVISNAGAGQVTTCELATSTHENVVDLAVKLFIEDHKYKLQRTAQ